MEYIKKENWDYYQKVRKGGENTNVLRLLAGVTGEFYSDDNIKILSPTSSLVQEAKDKEDYNKSSYVLLFTAAGSKKIVFAGDSDDDAWDSIMQCYGAELENIDLLIAPHHGRKTGGCSKYLDELNPKLSLFGNAQSEYLDYDSWYNKGLKYITNNQAGNIIIEFDNILCANVYVSNYNFALYYVYKYGEGKYRPSSKSTPAGNIYLIDEI